jgi:drug/metabolite transporter (DMT)-like permease
MTDPAWIWVSAALVAAAAQTARNTLQSSLTASLGALGATLVRFLYGLPFGVLFCTAAGFFAGGLPAPGAAFLAWTLVGAMAQIAATALMLTAMRDRSFVVVTVYTKTELLQVAILGAALLGDPLNSLTLLTVVVASVGVVLASWPKAVNGSRDLAAFRPALQGLGAGLLFAMAGVGYRGATLSLGDSAFYGRAALTLACALAVQTAVMTAWFALRDPSRLRAIAAAWRPSLLAGFMGALASLGWFVAFTLTTAANVKMVGLVEIGFAWIVSRKIFGEGLMPREIAGMALIVAAILATLMP